MNQFLTITLAFISLSGCSLLSGIDSNYPNDWPAIMVQVDVCGQLTGEYQNHGVATFSPKGGSPFLTYRFGVIMSNKKESMAIQTVDIECVDRKKLIIKASSGDNKIITKTIKLNEQGWRIEKGALYFPPTNETGADGTGGFVSKSEFRLSISEDGNLIGEERSGGVGLVLWLIPVGGTQTFWFRWPQATQE